MQHPILELAVWGYSTILMAFGLTGLGWFMVFRLAKTFSPEKESQPDFPTRALVIGGWIALIGGGSSLAVFLISMALVALKSLWP